MSYQLNLVTKLWNKNIFDEKTLMDYEEIILYVIKDFTTIDYKKRSKKVRKNQYVYICNCLDQFGLYQDKINELYFTIDQLHLFTIPFKIVAKKDLTTKFCEPIIIEKTFFKTRKYPVSFEEECNYHLYFEKIYAPLASIFRFCEPVIVDSFMPGILDTLQNLKEMERNCSFADFNIALNSANIFLQKTLNTMLSIGAKKLSYIKTPKEILDEKVRETDRQKTNFFEESKTTLNNFTEKLQIRTDLLKVFNK